MIELGQQHRQGLIKEHQPQRCARDDDSQQSKEGPEDALTRMMPVRSRRIHPGVTMMDQMELPHPFQLVLQPMDQVCPDQVQQQ